MVWVRPVATRAYRRSKSLRKQAFAQPGHRANHIARVFPRATH